MLPSGVHPGREVHAKVTPAPLFARPGRPPNDGADTVPVRREASASADHPFRSGFRPAATASRGVRKSAPPAGDGADLNATRSL